VARADYCQLKNYNTSVSGARAGVKVGFPGFAAKHREIPRARLRAKYCLAKSLADAAMGEAGRCLSYKCAWYGADLRLANRWYLSPRPARAAGTKSSASICLSAPTTASTVAWASTAT
jgi:hypothetical protein